MGTKNRAASTRDLRKKAESFVASFETMFGDADWDVTRDNILSEHLICPGCTFLEPGVVDPSSNWWNRGALLAALRALKAELERLQIVQAKPTDEI